MRRWSFIPLIALLSACQAEDRQKAEYREEKSRECLAGLSRNPALSAALDGERFCACVLDRRMAGRSAEELATFEPSAEQRREWGVQCADASIRADASKQAAPAAPPAPAPAPAGAEQPKR